MEAAKLFRLYIIFPNIIAAALYKLYYPFKMHENPFKFLFTTLSSLRLGLAWSKIRPQDFHEQMTKGARYTTFPLRECGIDFKLLLNYITGFF